MPGPPVADLTGTRPGSRLAPGLHDVPLGTPGHDLKVSINLRARIGRGGFGEVWWVQTRGSSPHWQDGALKVADAPEGTERAYLVRGGAAAMAGVPAHPHLLGLRFLGSLHGRPAVQTEMADYSLADLAGSVPLNDLRPRLLAAVREAAAGLDHLHAHGLVHGCPKPADILLFRGRAARRGLRSRPPGPGR